MFKISIKTLKKLIENNEKFLNEKLSLQEYHELQEPLMIKNNIMEITDKRITFNLEKPRGTRADYLYKYLLIIYGYNLNYDLEPTEKIQILNINAFKTIKECLKAKEKYLKDNFFKSRITDIKIFNARLHEINNEKEQEKENE